MYRDRVNFLVNTFSPSFGQYIGNNQSKLKMLVATKKRKEKKRLCDVPFIMCSADYFAVKDYSFQIAQSVINYVTA